MVRNGVAAGLVGQAVVLAVLAGTAGLTPAGWLVGSACGVATAVLLTRALRRAGVSLGPADWVTLLRATLVGGAAALVTGSLVGSGHDTALVALASITLVLDAVDGWLARRTGTVSGFGARFDMETDAFLIFVLSVEAARSIGAWVLAIGAARYAFVVAYRLLPWLREPVPPRQWRKAVAATQGVVLTVEVAGVLPRALVEAALVLALGLLAESFGRDIWWLRGRAHGAEPHMPKYAAGFLTAVAFLLVWLALVAPDQLSRTSPGAFLRIPVEGLVLVALGLVLRPWPRRAMALSVGLLLGVLVIVKVLDMGFYDTLDRPFNPVTDWGTFGPAMGVVSDSVGHGWAVAAVVGAITAAVAVLIVVPLALLRVSRLTAQHRAGSARAVGVLAVVWLVCAGLGLQVGGGQSLASSSAAALAYDQVHTIRTTVADQRAFADQLDGNDPYAQLPASDLLTGLRGKDVIVAFVESYGQVAVQDSSFSPQVDDVLNAGTSALHDAGYSARSAFLTSPTFGGISWLAHSTLQSGMWIDSQQRYDQLVASQRFTLSDAFKRAGWRTVADVPSNGTSWPEGTSFYHYDHLYNAHNVGYAGPRFSYGTMPDQYVLSAFRRLELARRDHRPVMAEIDLVSSHTPWAPLPHLIPWNRVQDGSVFDPQPAQGHAPGDVWRSAAGVQAAYGQSVQYTMSTLVSFLQTYRDPNLVLVVLGDHQPATIVSGSDATHNVPVSVIAHDPAVLDRISSWGWQDGLLPSPSAPVWPMDAFRDRFLTAYSSGPANAVMSSKRGTK